MSGPHQIWICLLAAIVASLSMAPLELQRRIINTAIDVGDVKLLAFLGAGYLAVLVLQGGLKFGLRVYQGWLSESAIRFNRAHLTRVHRRHDGEEDDKGLGRAVSVIVTEIDKLGSFVGEGLSQPVVNLGILIAIIGYMLVVEPLVAALSFLFLLPQIVVVPVIQSRINRLIERRVELLRGLSDALVDAGSERARTQSNDTGARSDRIYENRIKTYVLKYSMKAVVNLLNGLAPLTVLLVGGYMASRGETTIGVVVAFMTGFERLADPLRDLLAYYRIAAQANVQHRMIAAWI